MTGREMRCSASDTERSGRAPMSTAVIESTMTSEFCLMAWAERSWARMPVTTTSSTVVAPSDGWV